jgi:flavin-dependent dehydrogenase
MKQVNTITVVGGGTAGLITAIILKKRLNLNINLIYSKNIGIVGVGEGSTEHFRDFMEFVGIDQYELIKECDATYKCGIMFEGWGSKDYLHSVNEPFNQKYSQYNFVYAKQIAENSNYLNYKMYWDSELNSWFLNRRDEFPSNQFHFNTHKLNNFLTKIAEGLGICVHEDDISEVNLNETGEISSVRGSKQDYKSDFYIDATGFKRVLMSKLGAKWQSYSKYLKMNSAITFQTEDEQNYNYWTLSKAMDSGWLFRIPVWGRYGNGYIFDNNFLTPDQAKAEVEKLFGKTIEIGKSFNFDPGALDRVWIKNCCAVGLSSSFVEPLEATSIGTSIQQAFLLMHRILNYDNATIDNYNKSFNEIMGNIRDFICLHYVTDKQDTEFWKYIKTVEVPDSLKDLLSNWKYRLPIKEDFSNITDYRLFDADNFTLVLDGLNLINRGAIKSEYLSHQKSVQDLADSIINDRLNFENSIEKISHKHLIEKIRTAC